MDHYLDIRLRPDPEFSQHQLMNALFSKLHRALAEGRHVDIGASFPEVDPAQPTLGTCLRLHGKASVLAELMSTNWLTGMRDHIHAGETQPVPAKTAHRTVSRIQPKSSVERIRRRQMRRHGLDASEIETRIPDFVAPKLSLPFVSIRSQSTKQTFRLFIDHRPLVESPISGTYSSYGLSNTATVPWF